MELDDVLNFQPFPTASTIYVWVELVLRLVHFHVQGLVP